MCRNNVCCLCRITLVRDYLLCRLTLATGTRPGALNNVLLSDYETSRVSEGNRIILVPKHKRTKDGPAMLGMDPLMQKEMATYISKIRPAFAYPDEEKLFVKDKIDRFLRKRPRIFEALDLTSLTCVSHCKSSCIKIPRYLWHDTIPRGTLDI